VAQAQPVKVQCAQARTVHLHVAQAQPARMWQGSSLRLWAWHCLSGCVCSQSDIHHCAKSCPLMCSAVPSSAAAAQASCLSQTALAQDGNTKYPGVKLLTMISQLVKKC
jgi:hypothetical protein